MSKCTREIAIVVGVGLFIMFLCWCSYDRIESMQRMNAERSLFGSLKDQLTSYRETDGVYPKNSCANRPDLDDSRYRVMLNPRNANDCRQ
jgi:hypothetical protein